MLYKGQNVTEKIIFSSLNMSVSSEKDIYQFGDDALGKYIRIVGISFDGKNSWTTRVSCNDTI